MDFELLTESFPDRPETGPALSRILLGQVAAGERPATVRLSHPGRVVAFGRRDTVSRGYADAVEAARSNGFKAMERLSGGRAAVHTEGTISLTVTSPDRDPAQRTSQRFESIAELVRSALTDLGIDARTGEVPGEYCSGAFSINAGGRIKLAGVAQRMIKGAAHVGVVLIASDADLMRDVMAPVYAALGLDWDPSSAGAAEDEVPGLTRSRLDDALLERLAGSFTVEAVELDPETRRQAADAASRFRSPD